MIVTNQIKFDIAKFPMRVRPYADVGERAKLLLRLFDYDNGHQFAEEAGISYKSWNRIENGWQRVSHALWPQIARKCPGVGLDWLNWGNHTALDFELRKKLSRLPIEPSPGPGTKPTRRVRKAKSQ